MRNQVPDWFLVLVLRVLLGRPIEPVNKSKKDWRWLTLKTGLLLAPASGKSEK